MACVGGRVVYFAIFRRFSLSHAILLHASFKCLDIMVNCSSNMHLAFEFNFHVFFLSPYNLVRSFSFIHMQWQQKTTSFKRFRDSSKDSTHITRVYQFRIQREREYLYTYSCAFICVYVKWKRVDERRNNYLFKHSITIKMLRIFRPSQENIFLFIAQTNTIHQNWMS